MELKFSKCMIVREASKNTDEVCIFISMHYRSKGFPGGSVGKESPAMWGTWVQSLGWDDPLEKGMATHSSVLAWQIPWTEEPGGPQSTGSHRVGLG